MPVVLHSIQPYTLTYRFACEDDKVVWMLGLAVQGCVS